MRILAYSILALVAAQAALAADIPPAATGRPNIVYIMADDHGRQAIGCYGSQIMKTPNIDRLARDGMRFTQAFANNSICSPSRAVLLTGKYNHICGVEKLDQHFDGAQQTFPKLLQQAGYQTAIVGKWHLYSEPTGFDYYCVAPGNGGRYYDPLLKETGQPWINGNKGGTEHRGYMTDVITQVALDWLKRRDASKPFCLMIHHKAPDSPHDPAPRHKNLFKDTVFPNPQTLLDNYRGRVPEPVADQLVWSRLIANDYPQYQWVKKDYNGDRNHDTRLMYQEYLRGYLRLVAALDENVGRVLDYLDRSGLAANTIVIYASDNGYFLGEHGFYNKMWMYEEGFHIPLIVRLPGRQVAGTSDELVSMMDVAPTILDLAGAKVPADIQGCSMKSLILGEKSPWREAFYYHYYGYSMPRQNNWIASPDGEIFGVRTKTLKLICYPRWKHGPFWELFDLVNDPLEMHNLYADSAQRATVAEMKKQLHGLAEKYKDTRVVGILDKLDEKQ